MNPALGTNILVRISSPGIVFVIATIPIWWFCYGLALVVDKRQIKILQKKLNEHQKKCCARRKIICGKDSIGS